MSNALCIIILLYIALIAALGTILIKDGRTASELFQLTPSLQETSL
jgi:hypothetical protein